MSMTVQIPTSPYLGKTYVAPAVASGRDAVQLITGKKTEPENWVDDLLQVTAGAGSVAYTTWVTQEMAHVCPLCRSASSTKLAHIPNCAHYGLDYSCSCGADYSYEDIPTSVTVSDDEGRLEHLRNYHTPQVVAAHKRDFQYWSARSVPMGSQPIYDEGGYSLLGVELPDGRRVMR